jgi:hypothetical protein
LVFLLFFFRPVSLEIHVLSLRSIIRPPYQMASSFYFSYFYPITALGVLYISVSQPPGRGPVPGPGINYTGPREVLLEFVILFF